MPTLKLALLLLLATLCATTHAMAATTPPDYVPASYANKLIKVGQGTYRRWGVRVYVATLWAADRVWNPLKPFLLEIHYVRDLSKDTLVDGVMDDIKDQNVAEDVVLEKWRQKLNTTLPEVHNGDVLAGLAVPGKPSVLYFNGTKLAAIDDATLSKAFFNIWFGEKADEDLRASLLGKSD